MHTNKNTTRNKFNTKNITRSDIVRAFQHQILEFITKLRDNCKRHAIRRIAKQIRR